MRGLPRAVLSRASHWTASCQRLRTVHARHRRAEDLHCGNYKSLMTKDQSEYQLFRDMQEAMRARFTVR
eukprot:3143377-Pleurochrysis_carterae.AAC.4